jgi:hypothetical protein
MTSWICARLCRELAELSASDCKKALCCAKLWEGGYGKVHADILSYAEVVFWLCACKKIERR